MNYGWKEPYLGGQESERLEDISGSFETDQADLFKNVLNHKGSIIALKH